MRAYNDIDGYEADRYLQATESVNNETAYLVFGLERLELDGTIGWQAAGEESLCHHFSMFLSAL